MKRVVTPIVIQYEAAECGAACLKIVLDYYGKIITLSELREKCGTSRDGVTAKQIKTVASEYGLDVRAYSCSSKNLQNRGSFPCIIHWDFDHFLVVEGFTDEQAYLNDPMYGRRNIYMEDFEECFTGVVLDLKPRHDFKKGGQEDLLYRWIPRIFAPYKSLLLWLIVISVAGAIPELFIAGATSQFIDSYLQEGRQNIAVPAIWVTSIAILILIVLLSLQKLILRQAGSQLMRRISSILYISLFSLPFKYFVTRTRGEVATRLILPFTLVQLSISGVADFLLSLGSGIFGLLVGLFISPTLSLLTSAVAGATTVATLRIRESRKAQNYNLAYLEGKIDGIGIHVIQSIESVKASGLENAAFISWSAVFTEIQRELQQQSLASALIGLLGSTSGLALRISIILIGGYLIIIGKISLGELMAFQFLAGMIEEPLMQLGTLVSQLQELDGEIGRMNDVVDNEVDPYVRSFYIGTTGNQGKKEIKREQRFLTGRIEAKRIGFQFRRDSSMMFDGLSFTIEAGQHISVVGDSGSGKSTLIHLLTGLEKPTQGELLYDNRLWIDWDDSTLRSSIASVSQEVSLFSTSLENNITLWDPRFSSDEVIYALNEVGLLDELGGTGSLGLQINEGGVNLSGGQRQRIEIARSLLRRPKILFMDEATSSLDERREKQILANIKKRNPTLVTVAHRLHSAQCSDWVLVLKKGQLVEMGEPKSLAMAGGYYQRLLKSELVNEDQQK
jgi:ABC-type bacteriocin/lantibiotic exporter with double-glycine peptidase domain